MLPCENCLGKGYFLQLEDTNVSTPTRQDTWNILYLHLHIS